MYILRSGREKVNRDSRPDDFLHIGTYDSDFHHDPNYKPRELFILSVAHFREVESRDDT